MSYIIDEISEYSQDTDSRTAILHDCNSEDIPANRFRVNLNQHLDGTLASAVDITADGNVGNMRLVLQCDRGINWRLWAIGDIVEDYFQ